MFIRRSTYGLTIVAILLGTAIAAFADVYAYKDPNGVVTFTNVPTHGRFRRVLRDTNGRTASAAPFNASYDSLIRTASGRYNIDADLIRAVIKTESDFNATARSRKGAMGLMQLMPDTARLHNIVDAYNPEENVEGGVRHLKMLLDRYRGDLELSLAAYNAGSGAVEKHRGVPPFAETREYVRRVLRFYDSYRGEALQLSSPVRQ
ncbi:MAG: transglycosylase SLT domain-containing protein [Candidatus Binatia bacterium]